MFDDNPRVFPAPECLPHLVGHFYVSRGKTPFTQFLQSDGMWSHICHYYRNEAAAYRALDEWNGKRPMPPPLPSNIAADVVTARAVKHGR
jgi:hypothetical protein